MVFCTDCWYWRAWVHKTYVGSTISWWYGVNNLSNRTTQERSIWYRLNGKPRIKSTKIFGLGCHWIALDIYRDFSLDDSWLWSTYNIYSYLTTVNVIIDPNCSNINEKSISSDTICYKCQCSARILTATCLPRNILNLFHCGCIFVEVYLITYNLTVCRS